MGFATGWRRGGETAKPVASVDVDFSQTWASMQSALVADEKFTAVKPGTSIAMLYLVPTALGGKAKGATWDATEAARYTEVGAAPTATSSPTAALANGGTPLAGGVYTQQPGETHTAPTLTSGQRATVVQFLAGGGSQIVTYMHDGVAQRVSTTTSSAGALQAAWAAKTDTRHGDAGLISWKSLFDEYAKDWVQFKSGETIDLMTIHTAANGRNIRGFAGVNGVEINGGPGGLAGGAEFHGYYMGTEADGFLYFYVMSGPQNSTTENFRFRVGGAWQNWRTVTQNAWSLSTNNSQYVTGSNIILQDGHSIKIAMGTDRGRPIVVAPATDWANVGTISCQYAYDKIVSGSVPTSGRAPAYIVAHPTNTEFLIFAPDAAPAQGTATYTGLQVVGTFTPPANTVYDSLATVTTGIDFTKCDYIEWTLCTTAAGDTRKVSSFVPVVIGGTTPSMEAVHGSGQVSSFIASAADAAAGKLTNVDCHGVALETVRIRGWANSANGFVAPTGTTVRTRCGVSVNGGAAVSLFGGTSSRLMAAPAAGQMVVSVSASAGLTVSVADPYTGALEVSVADGTATGTITTTTAAIPSQGAIVAQANAGVEVTLGTLKYRMAPSGNRSLQVASATGSAVTVVLSNLVPTVTSAAPSGSGLTTLNLDAAGTFQYARAYNFGAHGAIQVCTLNDQTNGRFYQMSMEVGAAFNNNTFSGFRIV